MDAKENALRIVRFDHPERVVGGLPCEGCSYAGVDHEPYEGDAGHHSPVGTCWCDRWGVGYRKVQDGVMAFPFDHPLADLTKVSGYHPPDPDDPRICAPIYERAAAASRDGTFLYGSHRETLWERAYSLAGMDNIMMAFITEPDAVRELLHLIMDFQLGIARHYAAVGVEYVGLGDDLGTQRGLLFSRGILEEFFVPEYCRLFDLYKQRGVLIGFHSCGHVEPILDVFMDLGVDILNPVQSTANDLARVRQATKGRMALQGGISSHLLMLGPIDEIRKETRRRLRELGQDGGYFCAPDQGMPWPPEHIRAFEETVEECGRYPLDEGRGTMDDAG